MSLYLSAALNASPSPSPALTVITPKATSVHSPTATPTATPTSSPGIPAHQGELVLWLLIGGVVAAGLIVFLGRKFLASDQGSEGNSFIRSWIAISLTLGLLIFCAATLLGTNSTLQSILFGGLVASAGSAIAFYFAAQAGAAALNAVTGQGNAAPSAFSGIQAPSGRQGTAYSYDFVANGQPAPSYKRVTGTLPPGLTLDPGGKLQGTPTTPGTYTFTIAAFNSSDLLFSPPITVVIA